ncbi:MAG: hypothetical protein ACI9OJ_006011 [Myxococcota bacterium]|jgi:hypothetical protein
MSIEPSLPVEAARPVRLRIETVDPPPQNQRAQRMADVPQPGAKPSRYTLPSRLESPSSVGYRTRISMTRAEAEEALPLLALERPTAFAKTESPTESELFEESALGIMISRQSTNFRGFRQTTFGPEKSAEIATILRGLDGLDGDVLDGAAFTHIIVGCPYRTPFTMLLTLAGHKPVVSLLTVPIRAIRKRFEHIDDIPTIGYLPHLHLGILAEAMERASVLASAGRRRAQIIAAPFVGAPVPKNRKQIRQLLDLAGVSRLDRSRGWTVQLVAQVGGAIDAERLDIKPETCRKVAANILAFRSERIQPGVNQEEKAPPAYQERQDMDVTEGFVEMAARSAFNAFAHWTGLPREDAKDLLLIERVDVLTPGGKERLREIRKELSAITDRLIDNLPKWADLPLGRLFSRNANRGRKAFALAGQRIYIAGLSRARVDVAGLDWHRAVRAVGSAATRSALYVELMGCVDLPEDCDLLTGTCMMAGPVNQNDIGKQFYGFKDLLSGAFEGADPTSLLVWTFKAKTVADPIGNEEQLMNEKRKGALVDLRPGPHEVVSVHRNGRLEPMRGDGGATNEERAFFDQENFVTSPSGQEIPGNRGTAWPTDKRQKKIW